MSMRKYGKFLNKKIEHESKEKPSFFGLTEGSHRVEHG